VLGLVLYRLLTGEHPFAGAGLRHALSDAAHRDPAPFANAVASALPSGLQSVVLRLLDPDAARRPTRAATIADDLSAFLDGGQRVRPPLPESRGGRPERGRRQTVSPSEIARGRTANEKVASAPVTAWIRRLWPLAAGSTIALFALSLLAPAPAKPPPIVVAPEASLTQANTSAADCAMCHARQAAEWRRSVMAHAVKSPLFNALESLAEEQIGRDGGHLAALTALTPNDPEYQPGFEHVDTTVQACVPFYGIYDFTDRRGIWKGTRLVPLLEQYVIKKPLREAQEVFDRASPMSRVHEDAPPFLVVHGTHDTLVPVGEARAFVEMLRAASRAQVLYAELPGAQHAFEIFPSERTGHVLSGVERFLTWVYSRWQVERAAEGGRPETRQPHDVGYSTALSSGSNLTTATLAEGAPFRSRSRS
jgi:hypothetical protein